MDKMEPMKNVVFSMDGKSLPFDVSGKTIDELKELGFRDVISFDMKQDPYSGGAKPYMPPEEKSRI